MSIFEKWTTTFPGKMGLSWKRGWHGEGTKAEAEAQADKNCNAVAVPVEFFDRYKEYERRMVEAERELSDLKFPGNRPCQLKTCPNCQKPFRPFLRGRVHSAFYRWFFFGKKFIAYALICSECKEIVGYEPPDTIEITWNASTERT